MDSNITFRDAGGYSVAIASVEVYGQVFSPEHLLRHLTRLEDYVDALADCADVLDDLLANGRIVGASVSEVLRAAVAAQKAKR